MKQMLDIYSDYLIASFSQVTAAGLSNLLNGEISHNLSKTMERGSLP